MFYVSLYYGQQYPRSSFGRNGEFLTSCAVLGLRNAQPCVVRWGDDCLTLKAGILMNRQVYLRQYFLILGKEDSELSCHVGVDSYKASADWNEPLNYLLLNVKPFCLSGLSCKLMEWSSFGTLKYVLHSLWLMACIWQIQPQSFKYFVLPKSKEL